MAGATAWLLGDSLWWASSLAGHSVGFPSFVDVVYFSGYPLLVCGARRHLAAGSSPRFSAACSTARRSRRRAVSCCGPSPSTPSASTHAAGAPVDHVDRVSGARPVRADRPRPAPADAGAPSRAGAAGADRRIAPVPRLGRLVRVRLDARHVGGRRPGATRAGCSPTCLSAFAMAHPSAGDLAAATEHTAPHPSDADGRAGSGLPDRAARHVRRDSPRHVRAGRVHRRDDRDPPHGLPADGGDLLRLPARGGGRRRRSRVLPGARRERPRPRHAHGPRRDAALRVAVVRTDPRLLARRRSSASRCSLSPTPTTCPSRTPTSRPPASATRSRRSRSGRATRTARSSGSR